MHFLSHKNFIFSGQEYLKCKNSSMPGEQMQLEGSLCGHSGWVTQIATNPLYKNMLISSSRGILITFK